jgi:hypothetical protein
MMNDSIHLAEALPHKLHAGSFYRGPGAGLVARSLQATKLGYLAEALGRDTVVAHPVGQTHLFTCRGSTEL